MQRLWLWCVGRRRAPALPAQRRQQRGGMAGVLMRVLTGWVSHGLAAAVHAVVVVVVLVMCVMASV